MVRKEILESFEKLDLKSYLEKTLTSTDPSLLKTELHKHEKIEREIKEEMFQTYTANINHLVDILQKTHKINKMRDEIKDDLVEYKRVFKYFDDNSNEIYIDTAKQEEFKKVMAEFDEDADIFVTEKRYLVHSDVFFVEEENIKKRILLVFCNDLLIVGKNVMNKWKLKNAFNYSVIRIMGEDDKLIISVDPFKFIFTKDKASVDKAIEIYKEVTFRGKTTENETKSNGSDCHEIIEYLIFTEQYEKLVNYKLCINTNLDFENINIRPDTLPFFLELFSNEKNRKTFLYSYLRRKIDKKLFDVNIVQKLDSLIEGLFAVLHQFCVEAKKTLEDYGSKYGKKKSDDAVFILFISYQVQDIFNMLRRRIFGKRSTIDHVNEYLAQIKKNLYFSGYDFRYLIESFDDDKKNKQEQSYESTKQTIDKLLDEMIVEDYM